MTESRITSELKDVLGLWRPPLPDRRQAGRGVARRRRDTQAPYAPVIETLMQPQGEVEFVFPTGQYDKNAALNTGKNYYTIRPIFAVGWFPMTGLEVSAKFTYSFSTTNTATDYHSGQLFHFDYGASYAVTTKARVGVAGYFVKRTTNDTQYGVAVNGDGFRGQVFAIGPGFRCEFAKWSVDVRAVKDLFVRNRPSGESLWARAVIPF